MLNGIGAVYLREIRILRRRFLRHLSAMTVAPLLYIVAFGAAMGGAVRLDGHSYLEFLLPGLVAMTCMTQAYGAAMEINTARFYLHIFEEFQAAPLANAAYVLGEVLYGVTRAALGVAVILALGAAFGVVLHIGPGFMLAALLNAFVFASLAVLLAMLVRGHADQSMVNNFVITPMAFLGGTFFPVERLPEWAQYPLYLLPLTHAAHAIRADALGGAADLADFVVLAGVGAVVFVAALRSVGAARD
jgi:Nod factor-specific ABC transporter NodJ protein